MSRDDKFQASFLSFVNEAEEFFEENELVARLTELRESLRDHYKVGRTLQEQLDEAVEREQYELAAQLRDELARRSLESDGPAGKAPW